MFSRCLRDHVWPKIGFVVLAGAVLVVGMTPRRSSGEEEGQAKGDLAAQGGNTVPSASAPTHVIQGDLELYGTFHAMGVTVRSADPAAETRASLAYRKVGAAEFRQGFPLVRIKEKFVGSLFWLQPGTVYEVQVAANGQTFRGSCSTRAEIVIPEPERTIYVSPKGEGDGTESAPSSLTRAVGQAQPGDHIILRGGVYYEGAIKVAASGTPDSPIVIRGYPGETAILDGSLPEAGNFTWKKELENIQCTPIDARLNDIYLLVVDETRRIVRYGGKLADPNPKHTAKARDYFYGDQHKADSFYIDSANNVLYVNLHGVDASKVKWTVSRHENAFDVQGVRFVCFQNLTFRYYHTVNAALKFTDTANCLVQACKFHVNDTDVHIGAGTRDLVVQDNESCGGKANWPFGAMKEAWQFEVSGFRTRGHARGTIIRRNRLSGHGDGLGLCPSSDTDMYENVVQGCADDGVEVDGPACNVRLWQNAFKDCYRGISLSPATHGPVYCIRNTCRGGQKTWNMFKVQASGGRGPLFLMHNSSFCPGGLKPLGSKTVSWDLVYTRNNAFHTTSGGAWGAAFDVGPASGPLDMDYDDFYRDARDPLGRWNEQDVKDMEELRTVSNQEKHGLSVAPGFVDPANGKFELQPASPLIDAGVLIPGVNDCGPHPVQGAAPDVGALEYGGRKDGPAPKP